MTQIYKASDADSKAFQAFVRVDSLLGDLVELLGDCDLGSELDLSLTQLRRKIQNRLFELMPEDDQAKARAQFKAWVS